MTGEAEFGEGDGFVIDPVPSTGLGATCREILDTAPAWFGIPEANDTYVAFVDTHDTWVAYSPQHEPIGFNLSACRTSCTAERVFRA